MSFDSPFIFEDTLFYRYSTDQIFSFNLKTGDKQEVSDSKSNSTAIYSKLFNSKDFLGFSFMEAIEPGDEAQFRIMNILEKEDGT